MEKDEIMAEEDLDAILDRFIAEEKERQLYEDTMEEEKEEEDVWDDVPEAEAAEEAEEAEPEEGWLIRSMAHLTGLREVKEKLGVYERVVRFNRKRSERDMPVVSQPLHAMFLGSPGTGKTTVAKMLGVMLRRAGVLSKGHVVVRERATLLGQNYNSESEKTLAAIEEAQGGILLIDEAYQLYQPNDPRDPGKFVIETLLTTLANEGVRDWMLVLAGYPEEMRRMLEMNPGFKSRIPESNIYLFEDFTEQELVEIAEKYLSRFRFILTVEARSALHERLRLEYAHRRKNFGNARHVVNIIQTEIIPAMALRVTTQGVFDEDALTTIQASDIPAFKGDESACGRARVGYV